MSLEALLEKGADHAESAVPVKDNDGKGVEVGQLTVAVTALAAMKEIDAEVGGEPATAAAPAAAAAGGGGDADADGDTTPPVAVAVATAAPAAELPVAVATAAAAEEAPATSNPR